MSSAAAAKPQARADSLPNGMSLARKKAAIAEQVKPMDPVKVGRVEVKKKDVEEVQPSPVSLMPADLLKTLNEKEVLDLLAYLLSRGDPGHPMFRK